MLGRLVALITVATLGACVPLAHASVPDPLWVDGIYDAADGDDAVQAVTDGFGLRLPADEGPVDGVLEPSTPSIGFTVPASPRPHARSGRVDRAPPRS